MDKTKIRWTDRTWNPVTGCTKISPGCGRCYAHRIAEQRRGTAAFPVGFDIQLRRHKVRDPLRWRKPSLVFVNSMSDLFHREIPDEYLVEIWQTMVAADQHQYQVLTKRPHRMAHKIATLGLLLRPHIWLGVSAENQRFADNRIPALLSIGSPVPWVSAEPLLGPLDLRKYLADLKWVVAGGESGPGRQPMDLDWPRSLRDQCGTAGVAYFYKQGNSFQSDRDYILDGETHEEMPLAAAGYDRG